MTSKFSEQGKLNLVCTIGAVLGGIFFFTSALNFSNDFSRQAVGLGYASNFFDIQAKSLMNGELSVPAESLGIEGFQIGGKTYMYYGLFPALLRIPAIAMDENLSGHLTVTSMILAWLLLAWFTAKIIKFLVEVFKPNYAFSKSHYLLIGLAMFGVTGGTVLTYDAALPWVYHEVYFWQTAWIIAGCYWLLRLAHRTENSAIFWLLICCLGAVLTRFTGGFGLCFGTLLMISWILWKQGKQLPTKTKLLLTAAVIVPIIVSVSINLYKFDHPFMFPLEAQNWTEVNQHRRDALLANGGSITGPQFFSTAWQTYFGLPGIRFTSYFPWISLPANPVSNNSVVIDQSYRTASLFGTMPIFVLLTSSAFLYLIFGKGKQRAMLIPPIVATLVVPSGVMFYGYFANRYLSDFVPMLCLGSIISLTLVLPMFTKSKPITFLAIFGITLGFSYSASVNLITGLTTAATIGKGESLTRYLALQSNLSGDNNNWRGLITTSDSLPQNGVTDQIHIRGNCEGLYLHTGDSYEPWITVTEANQLVKIQRVSRKSKSADKTAKLGPPLTQPETTRFQRIPKKAKVVKQSKKPITTLLFTVKGEHDRTVLLDYFPSDNLFQIRLKTENGNFRGNLFKLYRNQEIFVGISNKTDIGYFEISSNPGGFVGYLPSQEWWSDWYSRIATVTANPIKLNNSLKLEFLTGINSSLCSKFVKAKDTVPE